MSVLLLSPKFKKEIEALKKCPHLLEMHKELVRDGEKASQLFKSESGFMSLASKEYHRRAGKNSVAKSIGGPFKALLELEKGES